MKILYIRRTKQARLARQLNDYLQDKKWAYDIITCRPIDTKSYGRLLKRKPFYVGDPLGSKVVATISHMIALEKSGSGIAQQKGNDRLPLINMQGVNLGLMVGDICLVSADTIVVIESSSPLYRAHRLKMVKEEIPQ
ncbi:MAG: hypothetical protein RL641_337 [Candidatus Parcubacteria bacterium]|jgi:hypothetical protein